MLSSAQTSLVNRLIRNDPYTTWLTLSHNHIGMDVSSLVNALASNYQVLKVSCHAPYMANLSSFNLSRLLVACAKLPQLEELWVALPSNRSHLSTSVVDAVAKGGMHKLTLRGMDAAGCVAMARSLNGMTSLRELNLYGDMSTQACLELLRTLKDNSSLQQLKMPDCGFNNACGRTLAEALRVNRSLTKLELAGSPSPAPSNAKGCKENLDVLVGGENETLGLLTLTTNPELQAQLSFYTHLNRIGISHLLSRKDITLADCTAVLISKGNENLSIIYHILSQVPHLLTEATDPVMPRPRHRSSLRPTLPIPKATFTVNQVETIVHAQHRGKLRSTPPQQKTTKSTKAVEDLPPETLHSQRLVKLRSAPRRASEKAIQPNEQTDPFHFVRRASSSLRRSSCPSIITMPATNPAVLARTSDERASLRSPPLSDKARLLHTEQPLASLVTPKKAEAGASSRSTHSGSALKTTETFPPADDGIRPCSPPKTDGPALHHIKTAALPDSPKSIRKQCLDDHSETRLKDFSPPPPSRSSSSCNDPCKTISLSSSCHAVDLPTAMSSESSNARSSATKMRRVSTTGSVASLLTTHTKKTTWTKEDEQQQQAASVDRMFQEVDDMMSRIRRSSESSFGGMFVSLTEDEMIEFGNLKKKKEHQQQRRRRSSKQMTLRASAA